MFTDTLTTTLPTTTGATLPTLACCRSHFGSSFSVMRRPRSVAARSVGIDDYNQALAAWRAENKFSLPAILGPQLVENLRGVQPHHVIQLSSLFGRLISLGRTNAMVLPSKLESALKELFASEDASGMPMGRDLYAIKVGRHISLCFSMLRIILLEAGPDRSNGKSNAFCRRFTAA